MAGAPVEVEQNSEPLKYKTWVLRVSIHCEGCKRKVKKILHSVEGVYTIDVDSKQHKVTVTGNVDPNILIRKLERSGKHAEFWSKSKKNNDRSPSQEVSERRGEEQGNQNPSVYEAHKNGDPQKQPPPENSNSGDGSNGNENNNANGQQVKQVRFEGNIPASAGGDNTQPANNPSGQNNGGGSGGKKKKKKKNNNNNAKNATNSSNNNNNNGGELGGGEQPPNNGGGPPNTEFPHPQYPNARPVNMSPPRYPHHYNRAYECPPTYYAPTPIDAVRYNTVYPSYTASYYSAPPPYSYAYVHHGPDVEPPPPSDWSTPASQPSDTFEMFSDENPNACSVM